MRRWRLGMIGLLVVVVGCAPTPTTPAAESVCQARAQLGTAIDAFQAVDPATASPGDYQFAAVAVREAFFTLREYRVEMADDNLTALNQAIDDLSDAADDLPDDATLPEAVAELEPELAAIRTALEAIDADLDCQG